MRPRLLLPALAVALQFASRLAAADFVHLVEAEDRESNRASVAISAAADASGGSYVNNPSSYNPLFTGDWPAEEAERLTIWARVRRHAIQLKTTSEDGKQTEFSWNWSRPAEWRWVNLGTHERAKLGVGFLIIRGADAPEGAGLDAVIVTNDPNFRPRDPRP
jgi:hypothetical protein